MVICLAVLCIQHIVQDWLYIVLYTHSEKDAYFRLTQQMFNKLTI